MPSDPVSGQDAPPSASTTALRRDRQRLAPLREILLASHRPRATSAVSLRIHLKSARSRARNRRSHARSKTGRFLPAREDAPARSDICFHSRALAAQARSSSGPNSRSKSRQRSRFVAIARGEILDRFAVGQIQSSASGDEKLAADGRLRIAENDVGACRARHFSRAQTRPDRRR